MLQYLINTTAIWLMSLILFDLFLRRESYHNYNRFYLLFTFVLGALLPLIQWQDNSRPYTGTFQKPVEQVIIAKQNIVSAGTPESTTIHWQQWLWIVYLVGALVAFILLVADMLRLMKYSRKGSKSFYDGWQVIATGKKHAPFSFRNNLYISNRNLYSDDEWKMILLHEMRHTSLLHYFDLLLLQTARILFWFHPLVYIYNKRLLLVHEYQADNAAARQPKLYGSFLIEQAMLQAAPSLSHSFNRSPIKNRIVMLSRKSTAASRTKMLVFLPLAMLCFVCFSKNGFSHSYEKNGTKVTWKGNTFEYSKPDIDTIYNTNLSTGKMDTSYQQSTPHIVSMNGKPLPGDAEKAPVYTGSDKDLRDYLLKNMREELGKLKDGQYSFNISNIIINEEGRIVYFDYQDMTRSEVENYQVNGPGKPVSIAVPATSAATPPSDPGSTNKSVTFKLTPKSATTFEFNDQNGQIGNKPFTVKHINVNNNYMPQEPIDNPLQQQIFEKVCQLMETAPAFKPARTKGKKVVCEYLCFSFWNHFQIKDHKILDFDMDKGYKEL